MNRDELEGKADQLKGKVKQATGDLTNDPNLHDEGVVDEAAGEIRPPCRQQRPPSLRTALVQEQYRRREIRGRRRVTREPE